MSDSLSKLQEAVIAFRDERDWEQFHLPKDLALGLSIEAGELAELFLWKTQAEVETALQEPKFKGRLADELADVLVFLLYLAESSSIDLGDAVIAKMAKNAEKYPVHKARGSATKYTDL